jgi:hypothetical protein
MDAFSCDEYEYLSKLKSRNKKNELRDQWQPLTEPMSSEESKLRRSISEKCDMYIFQLALAEFCGVLPTEKMKKSEFKTAIEAIDKIKWGLVFEMFD